MTLREQLKDPVYKQWFLKVPTLGKNPGPKPWRVFIQREAEGPWARADFPTYVAAFNFLKKHLKTSFDVALHCKPKPFQPPVVGIKDGVKKHRRYHYPATQAADTLLSKVDWCPHCRRMTSFRFFTGGRHPNLGNCDPTLLRCTICGLRFISIPPRWRR